MTALSSALAVALIPFLAVGAVLKLMERLEGRRERTVARQIMLTDAIHRELGPVAAPTVRRRLRGGWRVSMAVPLDRPATVAAILSVSARLFADEVGAEGLEIVLTRGALTARPAGAELPLAGRRNTAGMRIAA